MSMNIPNTKEEWEEYKKLRKKYAENSIPAVIKQKEGNNTI